MHRIVMDFGCARRIGRTTAMIAIFQSIIENIMKTDNQKINHIFYIVKRESYAEDLTRDIKTELFEFHSRKKLFETYYCKSRFGIIPQSFLYRITGQMFSYEWFSGNDKICKCPNCGYEINRKKAVIFLDGTTDYEDEVRKAFPENEWDLDLYLAT